MSEPRSWDVLARFLANEATKEEIAEIQTWIESDPENQVMIQKLRASFAITPIEDDTSDLNALWSKIAREVGRSKYGIAQEPTRSGVLDVIRRLISWRPVWIPATAIAAAALAWFTYDSLWNSRSMIEAKAAVGERLTVALNDGTRVVLDAGSRMEYPEEFEGDARHVRIHGQGYFQVAKDASRPFIVAAGAGEVEVLGTAFDIQSWEGSPVIVAVEEGRVRFGRILALRSLSVVLTANQVSSLRANESPTPPTNIDVARRLAWMHDEAYFDDAFLSEALDRLHRWHSLDYSVEDPEILNERLTIHLTKSDLQGSLDLIARLLSLDVSISGNEIRLTRRIGERN